MHRSNTRQPDIRFAPCACVFRSAHRGFTILEMLVVIIDHRDRDGGDPPGVQQPHRVVELLLDQHGDVDARQRAGAGDPQREYTAVAFLFDTETETYTLLPLELAVSQSASMSLTAPSGDTNNQANAYRPAQGGRPRDAPAGTGVYGLSFQTEPPGETLDSGVGSGPTLDWYAGEVIDDGSRIITPWIFPRNDPRHFTPRGRNPYDVIRGDALRERSGRGHRAASRSSRSWCSSRRRAPSSRRSRARASRSSTDTSSTPTVRWMRRTATSTRRRAVRALRRPPRLRPGEPSLPRRRRGRRREPGGVSSRGLAARGRLAQRPAERGGHPARDRPGLVRPPGRRQRLGRRAEAHRPVHPYYEDETVIAISDWIDDNAEIIGFNRYTGNVIRRSN